MLMWSRALTHVAACYGDDPPAPLALMAACPAARAAVEYSAAGAVMACDGVVVRRRHCACVLDAPVYMQSHTCELTVDRWDRRGAAIVTAASWWLLRAPPADAASALQPRLALCVRAMHDGDALPRADDDEDSPARPLDARVRGVRVQTRWRDVYARLCAVRVPHSGGAVDVSALRDAAAQLTVLQLCGTAATAALDWLPRCTQLQELTLQCSTLHVDLAVLPALQQLRVLHIVAAGVAGSARLPQCTQLQELTLQCSTLHVDLAVLPALQQLRVLHIVAAGVAGMARLPQCTQLQELTLQCSERCADVSSRSIDLSALPQLHTCTLFIDGRICIDLRRCIALRDVHVCRYYIVDNDVSSVAACTTLMLYRKSDDGVLRELAVTAYTDANVAEEWLHNYMYKNSLDCDVQLLKRSVLVHTLVACNLHWLARYTQLETVCIRHTRQDTQHNGDYSALAALPHLRKLDFRVPCVNLRTLAQCARLEELVLCDVRCIGDFSVLASAPRLRKVSLVEPTYALLRSLRHCTQLEELALDTDDDKTYTCDWQMLAKLPQLRKVTLQRVNDSVLRMIGQCKHIEVFDVEEQIWVAYNWMAALPRLREVTIRDTSSRCGDWIEKCTSLEKLIFKGRYFRVAYKVPHGLPKLRELSIRLDDDNDIRYVALSTQLVKLHLCSSNVDCTPLRALTQLRELHLSARQLYNTNALSHCTQLVSLSIECDERLCDVPCLDALTQLRTLRIRPERVSDLRWLASCTQLHTLSVTLYAEGMDYSPLGALTQLRELTIVHYGTLDVSWIVHCTQLETLDVRRCNVVPHDVLGALPRLRVLELCWSTHADLGWLARCTQLEKVKLWRYSYRTPLAPLAQLRELGLCDISEVDDKSKNSVTLWRNKAQASAPHSGTAPVHYRFTYTTEH